MNREEQLKKWREEQREGVWSDSDDFELCPEMQDRYEELTIEHLKEHNPKLLEIMKQAGLNVDEGTAKED